MVVGQHVDGVSCVYHDDVGAAAELARTLVERFPNGRFAFIGVRQDDRAAGAGRLQGFMGGLASRGIALEASCVARSDFTVEGGHEAARKLIEADDSITVIACATDTIAAGAIEAVQERYGKRPGEEGVPLVTGFGDNLLLRAVTGGIPTVHFAYRTSGERGAETLLDLMRSPDAVPMQTLLGYRLVGVG